jgi:predicted short-subunit dehydrogenase-like oxidoreductase (DUF2520 family)
MRVLGPTGRNEAIPPADLTLLTVPDREIAAAAAAVSHNGMLGHCSASAPMELLAPHERLNLHPLLTLNSARTEPEAVRFAGAACAIDGSTERAIDVATTIATMLGMRPIRVAASQRALYHAAASVAGNYLVTLQWAAEQLGEIAGVTRADLAPLARASLEAFLSGGFPAAISGPLSRGDEATVQAQREAIAEAAPQLLPLFNAMTHATRVALQQGVLPESSSNGDQDRPSEASLPRAGQD